MHGLASVYMIVVAMARMTVELLSQVKQEEREVRVQRDCYKELLIFIALGKEYTQLCATDNIILVLNSNMYTVQTFQR